MIRAPAVLKEDLRSLLRANLYGPVADDLGDDAEIALDSLSLTWLLHCLETTYGVAIRPTDDELAGFRSVNRVHAYLVRTLQASPDAAGGPERDRR